MADLDYSPARESEDGTLDLHDSLQQAARESPQSTYLRYRDASLTFSEAHAMLARIASQLPALSGLRVIILLPDTLVAALLHLECFSQGATIVPLSPFSTIAQVQYVIDRVRAELLFTTPVLHAKFAAILQEIGVVLVGGDTDVNLEVRCAALLRVGEKQRAPVRAVFFTSGTTGKPKGVCLNESNLLSAAWINRTILQLDSSRRSLIMIPMFDYYGVIQLYSHLMAKAACTLGESGQFPKSAFQTIESQAITDIVLVPFTLKALLNHAQKSKGEGDKATWRKLAYVASSSDQLSPELLCAAFELNPELTIVNVYGLTEAGRACYRPIRKESAPNTSIGYQSPAMKVSVDARLGQPGEIVISGPTVMLGYLQDVIDDEIRFEPVTEVRTADEGYVGDDGELHLLGRKDHLMSLHGVKLHPSEIEVVVNQISGVKDSLARLHQDEGGNSTVMLDLVADRDRVQRNLVLSRLREHIPRLFLPQVINFVDSIPRTEIGGKLIRSKD
jgi:acyl-CoA synthetase (AMP-forming)/AMP-acid ligase II